MAEAERSLTIFGWLIPGVTRKRSVSQDKLQSRSSSILQRGRSKEPAKPSDNKAHRLQKSVTVIEGKKSVILHIEEDDDDDQEHTSDKKVTLEVDYAATGLEG
jgi:hypothetical protein